MKLIKIKQAIVDIFLLFALCACGSRDTGIGQKKAPELISQTSTANSTVPSISNTNTNFATQTPRITPKFAPATFTPFPGLATAIQNMLSSSGYHFELTTSKKIAKGDYSRTELKSHFTVEILNGEDTYGNRGGEWLYALVNRGGIPKSYPHKKSNAEWKLESSPLSGDFSLFDVDAALSNLKSYASTAIPPQPLKKEMVGTVTTDYYEYTTGDGVTKIWINPVNDYVVQLSSPIGIKLPNYQADPFTVVFSQVNQPAKISGP